MGFKRRTKADIAMKLVQSDLGQQPRANKASVREIKSVGDAVELFSPDSDFLKGIVGRFGEKTPERSLYGVWFRGQGNWEWKLTPGVFRESGSGDEKGVLSETHIFNHARLHFPEDVDRTGEAFDFLCLLQHYRAPTRLLDWSANPLVALYFAVDDDPLTGEPRSETTDGRFVVLDALRLNRQTIRRRMIAHADTPAVRCRAEMASSSSVAEWVRRLSAHGVEVDFQNSRVVYPVGLRAGTIDDCARPIAVWPKRSNPRMRQQSGRMTLHGGKLVRVREEPALPAPTSLETEAENTEEPLLHMFRVPRACKQKIRRELMCLGIRHETLFPEREYQMLHIRNMYTYTGELEGRIARMTSFGILP